MDLLKITEINKERTLLWLLKGHMVNQTILQSFLLVAFLSLKNALTCKITLPKIFKSELIHFWIWNKYIRLMPKTTWEKRTQIESKKVSGEEDPPSFQINLVASSKTRDQISGQELEAIKTDLPSKVVLWEVISQTLIDSRVWRLKLLELLILLMRKS